MPKHSLRMSFLRLKRGPSDKLVLTACLDGNGWRGFIWSSGEPLKMAVMRFRQFIWVVIASSVLAPEAVAACLDPIHGEPGEVSSLPEIAVWYGDTVRLGGAVPDCLDWPVEELNAAIETNGRFVEPGGWDAVLARIGAVSAQKEIRYWSWSRSRWRELLADSAALSAPDPAAMRADFLPAELEPGRTLYLRQRPNGAEHDAVLRMEVVERSSDRLVIDVENANGVPVNFLLRVQPAQTRLAIIIEAEPDNHFRYRSLMGLDLELGPFLRGLAGDSLRHRSVAIFRYIAGIPTDQEPHAGAS